MSVNVDVIEVQVTVTDDAEAAEVTVTGLAQARTVNVSNVSQPGPAGATGPQGQKGDTGDTGPQGAQGAAGVGVPAGGTTGQVLEKKSDTDYDTEWKDKTGGSGSGIDLVSYTYFGGF